MGNRCHCRFDYLAICLILAGSNLASSNARGSEPLFPQLEVGNWPSGWELQGDAFAAGPTAGPVRPASDTTDSVKKDLHFNFADFPAMYRQPDLGEPRGAIINSYHPEQLERATGRLLSPPFTIASPAILLDLAGRPTHGRLVVNLLVDDKVIRQAIPRSQHFQTCTLDLRDLVGKTGRLEFIDQDPYIGSWLAAAEIKATDRVVGDWVIDGSTAPIQKRRASRKLTCQRRYFCIPARRGIPADSVKLSIDGRVVQEICLAVADGEPDFWQFFDLALWQGQRGVVEFDGWSRHAQPLAAAIQADTIPGLENVYREAGRPKLHFTPPQGWNNDVNGMTYYDGEWHLCYQYDPSRSGSIGRNMHWGHAVSEDLFSWQPLPIALGVDRSRGQNYSGSMIVDTENVLGLQQGADSPLIAFYTLRKPFWFDRHDFDVDRSDQCFAYSLDRGRTWTFDPQPAVEGIYATDRDPKVFWYQPQRKWIMAYFIRDGYAFYESRDLRNWTHLSHLRGFNECPDVFPLRVDDQPDDMRWVVINGDGQYRIGHFDGRDFQPDHEGMHRVAYGPISATQSFNNSPDAERRRVQMSWLHIRPPSDVPCTQMLSLPVELTLRSTPSGVRMFANPAQELEKFRRESHSLASQTADGRQADSVSANTGPLVDVSCTLDIGDAAEAGVLIYGVEARYVASDRRLWLNGSDRSEAPAVPVGGKIRLRVILDTCTADVFINDGAAWNTVAARPDTSQPVLQAVADGGRVRVTDIVVHDLRPPAIGGTMVAGQAND